MRLILTILFVLAGLMVSVGQDTINYNRLTFKKDVAFYGNEKYTGCALEVFGNKTGVIYDYQSGLLNCKFKRFNEYFSYSQGIVMEYIYYTTGKQKLYEFINTENKQVISIRTGIFVEGEQCDTIYISDLAGRDSLPIIFGVRFLYSNDSCSYEPIPGFQFKSATVSGSCLIDWDAMLTTPFIKKRYIENIVKIKCETDRLYFDQVVVSDNNSNNIFLDLQSVCVKRTRE